MMSFVAIIGSGALGGAVAHAIARRDRIGEVRLIDAEGSIARGKALDILQSSPIDGFSTRTTAADTLDAASGAAASRRTTMVSTRISSIAGSTFTPNSRMTRPLTLTRPSAISFSASRRLATPARASTFWGRSSTRGSYTSSRAASWTRGLA